MVLAVVLTLLPSTPLSDTIDRLLTSPRDAMLVVLSIGATVSIEGSWSGDLEMFALLVFVVLDVIKAFVVVTKVSNTVYRLCTTTLRAGHMVV